MKKIAIGLIILLMLVLSSCKDKPGPKQLYMVRSAHSINDGEGVEYVLQQGDHIVLTTSNTCEWGIRDSVIFDTLSKKCSLYKRYSGK